MYFAIELKPYRNETFTSWFIRNSYANGSDPKSFALAIWRQDSTWYKDIDRYISDEKAIVLSKFCSLNISDIKNLTLESIVKRLASDDLSAPFKWDFILPMGLKGSVRTNGLCFCPECLKSKMPYIKKEWKLAWCIACPVHKKLLVLTCEKCYQVFSPHLTTYQNPKIYFCTNCKFDLRQSQTRSVDNQALLFQKALSNIAFMNEDKQVFNFQTQNNKDLLLTLRILISFIINIYHREKYDGLFVELGIIKQHTFSALNNATFSRYNITDREYLLLSAYKVFQIKLEDFIILLQKHKVSQRILKRTCKYVSPTIAYILSHLEDRKLKKPPRRVFKKITPKTKDEVENLFNEIKDFL